MLCLIALAMGCEPKPTATPISDLETLQERIVFDDPLLLLPGARWEKHKDAWRFRNRASFVCHVRETPHSGLVVRLIAERPTLKHHFQVEWDGEPIGEPEIPGVDGLRIKIPSPLLTPGRHELTLKRVYAADEAAHRKQHQNDFQRIRYRYDERVETMELAELNRSRQIADFLQNGVLGTASEKLHRGGLLFVGPVRKEWTEFPPGTQIRLEARNLSRERAVFRALGKQPVETRVEPGDGGDMRIVVGDGPLILEIEGPEDGLYLWSMPTLEQAGPSSLPPIVLVTLDTTRRDAIGPYVDRPELTPTLSDFANRATLFENAYSTAPWTLPSHASIFTGFYPSKHGAGVSEVRVAHDARTMARELRRKGYLTAGFSAGELSSSRFGVAQGFHYFRDPDRFETPGGKIAEYVEDFLSGYGERPFFLWINYFDPHALYQAPEEYEEQFGVPELRDVLAESQLPAWSDLLDNKMSGWRGLVEGEGEAAPEAVEFLEAAYRAEIAYTDHLLDRLFKSLKRRGIFEDALIIITADHGELLGEGGYFGHGARLDPELVEIPLIIKWPGQRDPQREDRLTSQVDLYPTVLRAAGIEPPASDGQDLTQGAGSKLHQFVVFEEHAALVHPLPEFMKISAHLYGVQRTDFRQLVWESGQECARLEERGEGIDKVSLWNPSECGGEAVNVLEAIFTELGLDPAAETGEQDVPDHLRESLEALGYM